MNFFTALSSKIVNSETVMEWFREILKQFDPEYDQEEKIFQSKMKSFCKTLNTDCSISLEKVINSEEQRIAHNIIFLMWSGFQLNMTCFYDPTKRIFLKMDYEDIHKESIMKSFSSSVQSESLLLSFALALTDTQREQSFFISEYYTYWETVAYKVSHYIGFRLGNDLLPLLVPGYVPDCTTATIYRTLLKNQLHIDLPV